MKEMYCRKSFYFFIGIIVIAIACIIAIHYSVANIKISPDGKYKTSYNKYTDTITITNLSNNVKCYVNDGGSCNYSWSKDSKCLIINYKDERCDMLDMQKNSCVSIS